MRGGFSERYLRRHLNFGLISRGSTRPLGSGVAEWLILDFHWLSAESTLVVDWVDFRCRENQARVFGPKLHCFRT